MELTKQHRQALLHELDKAKESKELHQKLLNDTEKSKHIEPNIEICIFIAEQTIKLIEQSLINNEIDF